MSWGTGKTHLALQVGAELLEEFPDGACCVDLAPISKAELLSAGVAGALKAALGPRETDAPLLQQNARDAARICPGAAGNS